LQLDYVIFVEALNACANLVVLEEGICVRQHIIDYGWGLDVFVANSLVNMYAKCGNMEDACRMFNKMPSWNVVTWDAILGGCAMNVHGKEVLKEFE
jgi:pentatricopeptide repeat protein